MLDHYIMVRAKESGRMWIHEKEVWDVMDKTMFEVVIEGDDYESMRNMARLTNHDMNQELFEDIRRGFK
jgi:hypothetical protein